jgi:hypothetical protein
MAERLRGSAARLREHAPAVSSSASPDSREALKWSRGHEPIGADRRVVPWHLGLGKSNDVEVQRHLEAACTRWAGWGEGELTVGPQAEVLIRDRLGDLA